MLVRYSYLPVMKKITIPDADTVILALQDEIRRSPEARYDHRLHAILMVAQGHSAREVAGLLGDAPRTVTYWVHRFIDEGLSGLVDDERPGRPRKLDDYDFEVIGKALRQSPRSVGLAGSVWDGKTLSTYIRDHFDVDLGVRQCQRLFRQLGFRYRKPRPIIAKADVDAQEAYKKTPGVGKRPDN